MIFVRDCLMWLFCWGCWRFYTWCPPILPFGWELALLPWAGLYAYSTDWADFRATRAWNRAGSPRGDLAGRSAWE
jgi:hypothetical protein